MNGFGDEDLARLRVSEARKYGLQTQAIQRALGRQRKAAPKSTAIVVFLAILLAITLGLF